MINFISMMRLLRLSPADSIDRSIAFLAARYGKGGDDYLNCPLNEEEYARFHEALSEANSVPRPAIRTDALVRSLSAN